MRDFHYNEIYLCKHNLGVIQPGFTVITLGTSLRGDDNIAKVLVDSLDAQTKQNLCIFNLGEFTNYLSYCLHGHQAMLIIDAVYNKNPPSRKDNVVIIELHNILKNKADMAVLTSHGFSFLDELVILASQNQLPGLAYFFGVEINSCLGYNTLSNETQNDFPDVSIKLASLIAEVKALLLKNQPYYA